MSTKKQTQHTTTPGNAALKTQINRGLAGGRYLLNEKGEAVPAQAQSPQTTQTKEK